MKKWFKFLPIFVFTATAAQYTPATEESETKPTNRWNDPHLEENIIVPKITLLEYFAPIPKWSADVEFRPAKGRLAYQVGAGILPNLSFSMMNFNTQSNGRLFKNSIGGMTRGEFRFYFKESKVTYVSLGMELDYRFIKAEATIGHEPLQDPGTDPADFFFDFDNFFGGGNPTDYAYFEYQDLSVHRFSSSTGFTIGQARVFRNRFSFEWFIGTRIELSRAFVVTDLGNDAEVARIENPIGMRFNTNRFGINPAVATGVRFGWSFKRK